MPVRLMAQRGAAVCALIAAALMAIPAAASATTTPGTVWVNNATNAKAPYNSCANPSYKSIQAAIEGPSTTIHICKGTYEEQLQIDRAVTMTGEAKAVVKLPSAPAEATGSCAASGEQDLVSICGKGAEVVKVSNVTFEAYWPESVCNDNLYGINVGGGANLVLSNSVMLGAGAHPLNGCQGGVGIQVGRASTGQVASAMLKSDEVSGYQKNGITVDGKGSQATITKVTVTGAGPSPIAQNGIQISNGAVGKITEATITGNECNIASVCGNGSYLELEEDGAGVLFYKEGQGSSVAKSHIDENDLGISHIAESEGSKPQATITSDVMENDRYAGVMLGQGYAVVNKDEIRKGAVGVLLLQYWDTLEWPPAQEFGPRGKGIEDTIAEMSKHAVEGLSDNSPNDQFGVFTIAKSAISGNPGSVEESVSTNNPSKLKITTSDDS